MATPRHCFLLLVLVKIRASDISFENLAEASEEGSAKEKFVEAAIKRRMELASEGKATALDNATLSKYQSGYRLPTGHGRMDHWNGFQSSTPCVCMPSGPSGVDLDQVMLLNIRDSNGRYYEPAMCSTKCPESCHVHKRFKVDYHEALRFMPSASQFMTQPMTASRCVNGQQCECLDATETKKKTQFSSQDCGVFGGIFPNDNQCMMQCDNVCRSVLGGGYQTAGLCIDEWKERTHREAKAAGRRFGADFERNSVADFLNAMEPLQCHQSFYQTQSAYTPIDCTSEERAGVEAFKREMDVKLRGKIQGYMQEISSLKQGLCSRKGTHCS